MVGRGEKMSTDPTSKWLSDMMDIDDRTEAAAGRDIRDSSRKSSRNLLLSLLSRPFDSPPGRFGMGIGELIALTCGSR